MAAVSEGSVLLCDKPAGMTSHDVVAAVRRERGGKVGHAGTLDPFATGLLLVLLGGATRLQRFLVGPAEDLRRHGPAGLALEHRRSRRRADRDRRDPRLAGAADGDRAPAGADDLGGAGRRRAPLPQGAPRRGRRDAPSATSRSTGPSCSAATASSADYEIECSAGTYVRTLIETLGDAYCAELRRTAIGPFRVEDAGRELSIAEAAALVPAAAEALR